MVLIIQNIRDVIETPMTFKRIIYGYLQLNYILRVTRKDKYEIGHYKNASKIGFHFENGATNKIWQSKIYKDKYYFPKTITTTVNDDIISSFFSAKPTNKRIIYKPATDYGGYGIQLYDDIKQYKENKPKVKGILQYEIEPMLFKDKFKFDMRSHLLFVKDSFSKKYSVYHLHTADWVKVCNKIFQKNGSKLGGFLTNVCVNNYSENNIQCFQNFMKNNFKNYKELLERYEKVLKDIASERLYQLKKDNVSKCPNQVWIAGTDIIFDKYGNARFLEINGRPGIIESNDSPNAYFGCAQCAKDVCELGIYYWMKNEPSQFEKSSSLRLIATI
jgi:hypothetical protein